MELPITRPSIVSYADEINFSELLGKLKSDKHNGFIRITSGISEGYILFKNGDQVAASFDQYAKRDALEKIKSAMEDSKAVIEVFNLKETQIDYLQTVNKPYLLVVSKADDVLNEIKKSKDKTTTRTKSISVRPQQVNLEEGIMELPITRPSIVSYADEINFSELLGKLKSDKHNGFIRITSGISEGYILFKNGDQVAASFDQYAKRDALEKIKSAMEDSKAVIEVFNLKETQIDYLQTVNKPYLLVVSKADDVLNEIKKSKDKTTTQIEPIPVESQRLDLEENNNEPPVVNESKPINETKVKTSSIESEPKIKPQSEEPVSNNHIEVVEKKINEISENKPPVQPETTQEPEIEMNIGETALNETKIEQISEDTIQNNAEDALTERIEFRESQTEEKPMDRAEIMKKYGLKDVEEEEVENLLETYKGGSISDDDVEKIELTLMNRIKKSILGIPKIKGTEVMVFLDNSSELFGTINIITEYESKGFLSRIIGNSKSLETLKSQIITITQIEIKKSFRGFPEIVDNFEINVEVS